jgi:single-stranded-DNA-specific exonuclease
MSAAVTLAEMRGLTKRWVMPLCMDAGRASPVAAVHTGHASPGNGGSTAVLAAPATTGVGTSLRSAQSLVERVLTARGLVGADDIERFLNPRLSHLHDPSLLAGADDAAARLVQAVRTGEPVVIYGDYDVDGVTACAILIRVIKSARPDANVSFHIPHRIDEGYGLNSEALRQIAANGTRLVITVDCGITAIEEANVARELGLDLIITDHHRWSAPGSEAILPATLALVHPLLPNRDGAPYPFGELSGAGVAFKLAWRFATLWCNSEQVSEALRQTLLEMLPLAALGTIADVVPLVGENRIIARFGLKLIAKSPIVGLRALIEASDLDDKTIESESVGFVLAPRLNACGRLGHANEAAQLLITDDDDEADRIARNLARLNRERQKTERAIFEQAARMAEDLGMTADTRRIIVLAHESWHPGVVGIVCSRLVDRFGRPAVLLTKQGATCKGSARSVDGFSIHDCIASAAPLLASFGGHDMAAGLSLDTCNFDAFVEALTAHANQRLQPDDLVSTVRIDTDASLHELELAVVHQLHELSPFGRSNPRPALRVGGMRLDEAPRQMGAHGKHLMLRFRQDADGQRRVIRGVWWNRGGLANDLAAGMYLDAVVEPKINHFNGNTSVEVEVRDVRICEAPR